jgi:tripartite-type tricarboxylate transporter receptor subunit TctC
MSKSRYLTRRPVLGALAALALAGAMPLAQAQGNFPSKPITFVVPYPAGGANDMLGRLVGQKMGEVLGTASVVDNRPGAGALLGAGIVARAPADGYTLLVGGLATHAASPHLIKTEYDPVKDFEPIGMIGSAPIIAITANDSPYKSLKDVVDAARKDPQAVMYGSSGNGSPLHLAGELFVSIAKVPMTHVPYKGGNAHTMDLMGGRIDMIFDTLTSATPLITSGKVRPLAVASTERLPELPNVPTFAESGYTNFVVNAWYALYAPAKTSPEVLAKLHQALNEALADADAKDRLTKLGVRSKASTQDELAKFTKAELDRYGSVISAIGLKID